MRIYQSCGWLENRGTVLSESSLAVLLDELRGVSARSQVASGWCEVGSAHRWATSLQPWSPQAAQQSLRSPKETRVPFTCSFPAEIKVSAFANKVSSRRKASATFFAAEGFSAAKGHLSSPPPPRAADQSLWKLFLSHQSKIFPYFLPAE